MITCKIAIDIIFNIGLYINAFLFVPQAIKLLRNKDSSGVSFLTFLGFNIIQLSMIVHALKLQDWQLFAGMSLSLLICGTIIVLILVYRKKSDLL